MNSLVSARFDLLTAWLVRICTGILVPVIALVGIFLLDLLQPVPVVFSVLYVAPIVLTVGLGRPRATYLVFVVSSVATVAGAAFGAIPDDRTAALINRALALAAQVLAAAVVIQQLELRERERTATAAQESRLEALRHQERQKDEFLSVTVHELRTPISTLRGYAQMAQTVATRIGSADGVAASGRIIRQADRLNRLVADLSDVSRIWTGELDLRRESLDLAWLVRETVEQQRVTNPHRRIDLHCDGPFPALDADSSRLEQVLGNLIENAIKYSPDGGPIRVRLWRTADEMHLAVSDEGIGIPPGEQERLFERFYRGQSSAKRFRGTGAGLFISRRIIEGHGGRMWAESVPNQGSTFGFALPIS